MLSFDLPNINWTFFPTSKSVPSLMFVWLLIRYFCCFFHFKLELHERHPSCFTSTSKNIICALLLPFLAVLIFFSAYILMFFNDKYIYYPCLFVEGVLNWNSFVSVSPLTSKNISGTLFAVCLFVNMFFLQICCILTWKCISHSYLIAFCTLNIRRTTYLFIYSR